MARNYNIMNNDSMLMTNKKLLFLGEFDTDLLSLSNDVHGNNNNCWY